MSRSAVSVLTTSTSLFSQTMASAGNNLTVIVQNPASNSDSIEVAWDDVDIPLTAGTGQIIPPDGEWRSVTKLPMNANNRVGMLGISLGAGAVSVRVMAYAAQ